MDYPIIGLFPLWNDEKQCTWMRHDYIDAIILAGGIPVVLPLLEDDEMIEKLASQIDGLFLTGGQDINPSLYHEEMLPQCGRVCDRLDTYEWKLIEQVMAQHKPIFAVCRGFQFVNIFFHGTLFQDIPTQYTQKYPISHQQEPPYDQPAHEVRLVENSLLAQWFCSETLQVSSRHHQGIKQLGEGLEVEAIAPDGLIEAIRHPKYPFLVAVQWHPESIYKNEDQERILFEQFVASCKKE